MENLIILDLAETDDLRRQSFRKNVVDRAMLMDVVYKSFEDIDVTGFV